MWQIRAHRLLLSCIHSNHKYSHLCFSLSFLCNNWNDHHAFDINLEIGNPKYVSWKTPLDLTRDSYTQHKTTTLQNVARVFTFILKAKHRTLHVIWAWAELENLQTKKNNLHELRSIEFNFRSIEACRKTIVVFCNYSISTLPTNTFSKSKTRPNVWEDLT